MSETEFTPQERKGSKDYRTVLFVTHREEILRQAALSFRNVRGSEDYGFFDEERKCTDQPVVFAHVATLGQERSPGRGQP